jgi:flagellar secretion chaperone FliS
MYAAKKYAQATQETASKERLMVLLFEAALRHMNTAAAELDKNNAMAARIPLRKSMDIVLELDRTLDDRQAPELAEKIRAVYDFVAKRLLQASVQNQAKLAHEAAKAFAPLVEGFSTAVASLAKTEVKR